MEHYKELIELRKKHQNLNINYEDDFNLNYPATIVSSLFQKQLSKRDLCWLVYESLNIVDRQSTIFPRPIVMELKNYIFLLEKDNSINELIKDLYKIEKYTPLTCLIPINDLSETIKNSTLKLYRTLVGIEESMKTFAVGSYNGKKFSYCRYPKINKYIAKVFIENNCSILFSKFNNCNCIYFDPMSFENSDLEIISQKLSKGLNVKTIVDYDYDNYSISMNGDYSSIQIFNIINEDDSYKIKEEINSSEVVKQQINTEVKFKINKPIFNETKEETKNIEIKPKFSKRFKQK